MAPTPASLVSLLLTLTVGASPALAAPVSPEPAAAPSWAPPFDAELQVDAAYVHQRPDNQSPPVGLLKRNSRFRVTGCTPSCEAPKAWALLGEQGAIRLSLLKVAAADTPALEQLPEFLYGKVMGSGADVRAEPDAKARRVKRELAGRVLAFARNEELLAKGWLARPGGGFVSARQIRIDQPSSFQGEEHPSGPIAFLFKAAKLTPDEVTAPVPASAPDAEAKPAEPAPLPKFTRFPLLEVSRRTVHVPGGTLPRDAVRLAFSRPRPASVPPGAKWVHVDLTEQVLTAYEGDTWVYATLVSTGQAKDSETVTHSGLYRVWTKTLHELMAEEGEYFVEEVPYTQYFHNGEALHGAFWHSSFGRPVTHGCVNLSLADARWLFAWAPPVLPSGWHSYLVPPGTETLWVQVERARPGVIAPSAMPEVSSAP